MVKKGKEAEMFCRNCGKELIGTPEICVNCGAKPLASSSFCQACGAATNPETEICMKCGARVARAQAVGISEKSRLATILFVFFLGWFGAHRFYLRKYGTAVAMLILGILYLSTAWLWGLGYIFLTAVGIWALIDFIYAVAGNMKDKEGKPIKNW
jgi:TM2 domain-containing membrane protein YozV